jgi:hypothetical protein
MIERQALAGELVDDVEHADAGNGKAAAMGGRSGGCEREKKLGASAIARRLGIGRASVYRVLGVPNSGRSNEA